MSRSGSCPRTERPEKSQAVEGNGLGNRGEVTPDRRGSRKRSCGEPEPLNSEPTLVADLSYSSHHRAPFNISCPRSAAFFLTGIKVSNSRPCLDDGFRYVL